MNINLNSLLPEDMSDEIAYHLVDFFSELTLALEDYYFASRRPYSINNIPSKSSDCPEISDDENPF